MYHVHKFLNGFRPGFQFLGNLCVLLLAGPVQHTCPGLCAEGGVAVRKQCLSAEVPVEDGVPGLADQKQGGDLVDRQIVETEAEVEVQSPFRTRF